MGGPRENCVSKCQTNQNYCLREFGVGQCSLFLCIAIETFHSSLFVQMIQSACQRCLGNSQAPPLCSGFPGLGPKVDKIMVMSCI